MLRKFSAVCAEIVYGAASFRGAFALPYITLVERRRVTVLAAVGNSSNSGRLQEISNDG